MTMIKTNENGRSMIEMLGVLAIIGVLSVGGIAGYSKAMNKFKTNKVADNVSMLVANIKTMYAQQNTYKNLSNSTAVTLGVVPDELVVKTYKSDGSVDSTSLKNAYNGDVEINASESTSDGDNRAFTIYFGGLSKEACVTLATNDWGSGYSSGLIALRASGTSEASDKAGLNTTHIGDEGTPLSDAKPGPNGTTIDAVTSAIATPGGKNLSVPMNVTQAASACSCKTGNKCSITWKYY